MAEQPAVIARGRRVPLSGPDRIASKHSPWLYETVRLLFRLSLRLRLLRYQVDGIGHVPSSGPVILMSNHESNFDPLLIGYPLPRRVSIPGKAALFRVPVLKAILRGLGSYPVERSRADAGSLRASIRVLKDEGVLTVFPEGRRSRDGKVAAFSSTLTRLALQYGVAVVPVGISGSGRLLAAGQRLPRIGTSVSVRFGEPITFSGRRRRLSDTELEALTQDIRSRVVELTGGSRI